MRKFEYPVILFFPLIFIFWLFFYKGHIGYWEDSDFFLCTADYWKNCMVNPGGLSEYVGNFLIQFYKWPLCGALLLTLIPFAVWGITKKILFRLGIGEGWFALAMLPALAITALLADFSFGLGEGLKVVFFFLGVWMYILIPRANWRYIFFTLFFPIAFLLLSAGGVIFLYGTFLLYEWIRMGKKEILLRLIFTLLWILFVWLGPLLWQSFFYPMADIRPYVLSRIMFATDSERLLYMSYAYLAAVVLISVAVAKMKARAGFRTDIFSLLVICAVAFGLFRSARNEPFERLMRIDRAAQEGNWDGVLKITGRQANLSGEELYFATLALANRGEMGELLFNYPVDGVSNFYLDRNLSYFNSIFGSELYYRLGVVNEALHWTFEASLGNVYGMNFRTLKRMIELNILRRDFRPAEKYLHILRRATCYGNWCGLQLQKIDSLKKMPEELKRAEFFVDNRGFLSDMARLYDVGCQKEITIHYLLCGVLLNKQLDKFCKLFTQLKPYKPDEDIPKAYEEALLVANVLGHIKIDEYHIRTGTMEAFGEYNALFGRCKNDLKQAKVALHNYKHTWWYYMHFGGQTLNKEASQR